jgi:hypothetical protein
LQVGWELTFNAPGFQIFRVSQVVEMRVVEHGFRGNTANIQTRPTQSFILLHTHRLQMQRTAVFKADYTNYKKKKIMLKS